MPLFNEDACSLNSQISFYSSLSRSDIGKLFGIDRSFILGWILGYHYLKEISKKSKFSRKIIDRMISHRNSADTKAGFKDYTGLDELIDRRGVLHRL